MPTYSGTFFQLHSSILNHRLASTDPGKLLQVTVFLKGSVISHNRVVFNFFDLIGELGGVIEVFILFFGFFIFPVARHLFVLKAIKLLFYARTKDESLFLQGQNTEKAGRVETE